MPCASDPTSRPCSPRWKSVTRRNSSKPGLRTPQGLTVRSHTQEKNRGGCRKQLPRPCMHMSLLNGELREVVVESRALLVLGLVEFLDDALEFLDLRLLGIELLQVAL